jgi:hypothetical protein
MSAFTNTAATTTSKNKKKKEEEEEFVHTVLHTEKAFLTQIIWSPMLPITRC